MTLTAASVSLAAALAAWSATGCGGGQGSATRPVTSGNTPPMMTTRSSPQEFTDGSSGTSSPPSGGRTVSWAAAKRLIRECQVTEASQAHSLSVSLRLVDRKTVSTTEPEIDLVIRLLERAERKCGQTPIAVE